MFYRCRQSFQAILHGLLLPSPHPFPPPTTCPNLAGREGVCVCECVSECVSVWKGVDQMVSRPFFSLSPKNRPRQAGDCGCLLPAPSPLPPTLEGKINRIWLGQDPTWTRLMTTFRPISIRSSSSLYTLRHPSPLREELGMTKRWAEERGACKEGGWEEEWYWGIRLEQKKNKARRRMKAWKLNLLIWYDAGL